MMLKRLRLRTRLRLRAAGFLS